MEVVLLIPRKGMQPSRSKSRKKKPKKTIGFKQEMLTADELAGAQGMTRGLWGMNLGIPKETIGDSRGPFQLIPC